MRKDNVYNVKAVIDSNEPVIITGKNASAVIVGESAWRSIEETLYLVSIPGMRQSILNVIKEPKILKVIRMWPLYE